jgi:two-component system chemotaxis sensor kinase CheA
MAEDLTEELQLFIEDMNDQLSIMESTLLDISEISLDKIDKEMINNLFRAMHTMKGNAGVFGYDIIITFSHKAESLLDLIRNDKILLTDELLELFLLIKDHSKLLVEICTQDMTLESEDKKAHNHLLDQLNRHLSISENDKETSSIQKYTINITLKSEFFESGMDMVSIIKYLSDIGNITRLKLVDDNVPSLKELSIKKAYIKFEIDYETDEDKSEIEEAFEFVEEDIELDIAIVDTIKKVAHKIQEVKEKKVEFKIFKKPRKKTSEKKLESKKVISSDTNMSLRVDSSKIDKIINQISEMVIANAKITQYAINTKDSDFEESVTEMSEMLQEIRDGVMNIRMVQVAESFSKLRRVVTDTSKKLGKNIGFEIIGGETELDKTVIEKISDPLVHMLRNAIDHGIETKEVREEHGKNPKGNIILKAYPDTGSIIIQIIDDGAGIDKETIYKKAIEKKIIQEDASLTDKDIYNLLFHPGFSTAQKITDISGRGVGMDVVKRNITDLRGSVDIQSDLGKGTTVTIRLPLTLAIIDGFLVNVGNSKYIIPLDSIQECIEFTKSAKDQFVQNGYISLRKDILPVLDLAEHLNEAKVETKRDNIVVVKHGSTNIGFKVGELFGEFQTVIKPLGALFENMSDISGGTILGDGEIALICDVPRLIEHKISYKEV